MAEQEQRRSRRHENEPYDQDEVEVTASQTTEAIDELLDEIDSVLEENAEEFVKNYVQKGGE